MIQKHGLSLGKGLALLNFFQNILYFVAIFITVGLLDSLTDC